MVRLVKKSSTSIEHFPECEHCPKLCDNSLNVCMEGSGPSDADIMIVGEAPGATEDEFNLPFVGRAGEYLRDHLLVSARIPESRVRFTNAVRCHPPKNRNPTSRELRMCRSYLEAEIRRIGPKVIVGLGNVPLASLLSRFYKGAQEEGTARKSEAVVGGITAWRGKPIWLREFNCWFIPTFHPSYCMRNVQRKSAYSSNLVIKDLEKAYILSKKPRYTASILKTVAVDSLKDALYLLQKMVDSRIFAFDIETGVNANEPAKPFIIGCSFANCDTVGYYIPWSLVESHKTLDRMLRSLLINNKLMKLMHNGAYEIRVLRFNGIPIWDRYFDTMIAAHMVDENFTKRLKDLTWVYTDFGGYDTPLERYKAEHAIKADYAKIPYELLSKYGALDAVATWVIYEKTKAKLNEEHLLPLFSKVSMPVRRVMSDAEIVGIRVDEERAELVKDSCRSAISRLEDAIYSCAGREFNISSPRQLQDVLYTSMGFRPLKETKTGYSTDKESIDYLSTQPNSDIAQYLSDLSYVKTMLKTHIKQALEFRWDSDSRIHANYNLTGTVTGRSSCSNPSLQNVPADRLVRSIYTATPGNFLIEADLKSAELATIAAVSGESTFLEAFENGLDPHSQTYRRIYDLPESYQPTKLERRKAKTINFGLVYGISEIGLSKNLGISVEEAQEFMTLYFERLSNVKRWMDRQKRLVRRQGYVVSMFNRKRRLPMGLSDSRSDIGRAERQAMNAPIQSGAADYTYIGLIRLSRILKKLELGSKIVHTVHDCGLVDTFPMEKNAVVEAFHEAFETPINAMPVNMKIDVELNRRWGEHNESRLFEIFKNVGLVKLNV